jgi:hypothetical protein
MIYSCCNENRKAAIVNNPSLNLNGIDYLEELDHDAIALNSPRQQTLLVHCLNGHNLGSAQSPLTPANVMIEGGESITSIGIQWVSLASAPPPQANALEKAYFSKLPNPANILVVRTDKVGDFSTYTFRLVNAASQALGDPFEVTEVLAGFDPQLAEVQFSFKVECGPSFDCQPQTPNCPPAAVTPPSINYLAKDYGSFRQIILDRMSQLLPGWSPSNEADLGVVLAELIAYVGDNLSYQQDAIATEAYLETARSRVSLRRHALLVDYHVHDGCNARAWIQLQVAGNPGDQIFLNHAQTRFYAYAPGMPASLAVGSGNEEAALLAGVQVFEPMQDAVLYPEHSKICFYTWGDTNCCLPKGATEATLLGSFPNLQPADVLIFQEVKGPQTGNQADADIRHRCAVRLTQVATQSANGSPLVDPLFLSPNGKPSIGLAAPSAPVVTASTSAGSLAANTYYTRITYVDAHQGETAASAETTTVLTKTGELTVTSPSASGGAEFYNVYISTTSGAERRQNSSPISIGKDYTQSGSLLTATTPLEPTAVTEIQWSQDDALPFPVCISSEYLDANDKLQSVTDVSVVYGNVVLADQGLSFSGIALKETVPAPRLFYPPNSSADRCQPVKPTPLPVRYRPSVPDIVPGSSLTQAVPLPLAGNPMTPGIVMLGGTGFVNLVDSNGFICLMIQADDPYAWPQFFAVLTNANSTNPANLDLAVIYNPPTGPTGVQGPVVLEKFTNLSFKESDPNYVAKQINQLSKLILVPSSYVPPASVPPGFPATPTMLPNTGSVSLLDTSNKAYLTLQATNPGAWPQSFGVVSQDLQQDPPAFNLVVVYNPSSGGVGVNLPVNIEQFSNVSLTTVAGQFASNSELIIVKSFAQAPNPSLSAYALMNFDPSEAVPVVTLTGAVNGKTTTWTPEPDLLESGESDPVFVVEVESDGTATLRFGDNINGKTPDTGTSFVASFRVGNGTAGNVGADSLVYLAAADARIQSCTNPLPATGGTDPETSDQIRRRAPQAFLTQERAITMADYENIAEMNPQVDNAVASLRWTGSWYTTFIAVQPEGGGNLSPALQQTLMATEERYRLAGQDLLLDSPQYVSLEIVLQVCVDPSYFQADVEQSLMQVLGSGILPDGTKGLFYPDNFTFGQTVYLSPVYVAARSVPGVTSVTAITFQPQGVNTTQYLAAGEIKLGALQVARLDNDPNFPDHGQLTLMMQGGK